MTAPSDDRPSRPLARWALALLAVACLAPGARAQDEALPSASERLGFSKGRHRLSVFAAFQQGGLAHEANIQTAPVSGSPQGSEPFQPQIELDAGSHFGLRYGYQFDDHWGFEASWSRGSSELSDGETFIRDDLRPILENSALSSDPAGIDALLDRLAARSGPFGIDVSYLDLGFVFIANPKGRWMGEVNAGLGWSWGALDASPMILERLVHSYVEPGTSDQYVIANTPVANDPTFGEDCAADDDPCVSLRDGSGLTWHVGGGVSYAFTDAVHLRLGIRVRWIEQIVDPADSFLQTEGTFGLSFLVGGK